MRRRAFLRGSAWVAGASLLVACAPSAPSTPSTSTAAPAVAQATSAPATAAPAVAGAPNGVLNFAKPGKVQSRDPQKAYDLNMFVLLRNVYEPLVDMDQQGKLYGVLAESWQPSSDGKTWTIKLRQGVKFHDGTAFDAQSVKATVTRAKGNTKSGFAFVFKDFEDEPVVIVDPYTVELHTKVPLAPLMNNIAVLYMVPPQAATNLDMTFEDAIGTGPFRLTDFNIDQQYVLEANPNYWQPGYPKLGKVVYRPILEQSSLVAALRAGQADLIEGIS